MSSGDPEKVVGRRIGGLRGVVATLALAGSIVCGWAALREWDGGRMAGSAFDSRWLYVHVGRAEDGTWVSERAQGVAKFMWNLGMIRVHRDFTPRFKGWLRTLDLHLPGGATDRVFVYGVVETVKVEWLNGPRTDRRIPRLTDLETRELSEALIGGEVQDGTWTKYTRNKAIVPVGVLSAGSLVLGGVGLVEGVIALRAVVRGRRGYCPKCGYDLRGLAAGGGRVTCPECGR